MKGAIVVGEVLNYEIASHRVEPNGDETYAICFKLKGVPLTTLAPFVGKQVLITLEEVDKK